MTAFDQDLTLCSGDDRTLRFTITDDTGVPVNLTGMLAARWGCARLLANGNYVLPANVTKSLGSGVTLADAPGGVIEVAITGVETSLLTHIENFPAGKRKDVSVTLKIEQRAYGGSVWSTVTQPTITGRQQTPLYWGYRWRTASYGAGDANGKYDIRVTRLTSDFDEERNYGKFTWNILRTITTGSPVPVSGVTMIAVRIKGSGQLQGTLDEYSVEVQTLARDWNGSAWVWRQTSSPVSV